ncbi:hypothetical protein [Staphylococcus sp. GFQ9D221P]|uniref:hypothetical protein n=1 Tax=Staphylococcus sp. GFQ9D221P TaxID=2804440 RepID=UPI0008529BA8|nr:hypothetical protein [Staphylococcus sp. GFQ9D221P]OEK94373.1 hypothetical protein AST08_10035 [Staphylococcus saprophyticus]SUM89432.1 Uncharacterised protein [Staphylococcus saprophyticus]
MTVKLIGSYNDSCDDTHISKHIKKDTPLSDVPTHNIAFTMIGTGTMSTYPIWILYTIDLVLHNNMQTLQSLQSLQVMSVVPYTL